MRVPLDELTPKEYVNLVALVVHSNLDEMRAHMNDDLPNECVGWVWMNSGVQRLINQARSPHRFSVGQAQAAEAMAKRSSSDIIMCVYHSHPGGKTSLSGDDEKSMSESFKNDLFIPWAVITETDATLHWLDDGELMSMDLALEFAHV